MQKSEVRAKKHLGQHFLKDKNIALKIVSAIPENVVEAIIEIGPGTGILTEFLLQRKDASLYAVEIDNESVKYLKEAYPSLIPNLMEADFLKIDLNIFQFKSLAIVGNFPYNISSQIFFHVLKFKDQVDMVVCMLQREVALRLSTGPGSKTYGILSVFLQMYYDIEYLFTVNETVFIPPPKVKSAVIRLKRNQRKDVLCNEQLLFKVVKAAFNQRRKTMRNSLSAFIHENIKQLEVFNLRPEQLSVEEFIDLTNLLEPYNQKPNP